MNLVKFLIGTEGTNVLNILIYIWPFLEHKDQTSGMDYLEYSGVIP